jgi:hypothetical protein
MKFIYTPQTTTMQIITLLAFLAFVIIIIGYGPLLTIWSLNTVFGLKIAYTFGTWLGVLFLSTPLFIKFKK